MIQPWTQNLSSSPRCQRLDILLKEWGGFFYRWLLEVPGQLSLESMRYVKEQELTYRQLESTNIFVNGVKAFDKYWQLSWPMTLVTDLPWTKVRASLPALWVIHPWKVERERVKQLGTTSKTQKHHECLNKTLRNQTVQDSKHSIWPFVLIFFQNAASKIGSRLFQHNTTNLSQELWITWRPFSPMFLSFPVRTCCSYGTHVPRILQVSPNTTVLRTVTQLPRQRTHTYCFHKQRNMKAMKTYERDWSRARIVR